MKANKLKALEIEIQKSETFKDLLQKISKTNPVISPSPFVNIDKVLYYNPVDRARSEAKDKKKMSELQEQNIFKTNPQEIIVTDNCLKREQVVFVKVVEDV